MSPEIVCVEFQRFLVSLSQCRDEYPPTSLDGSETLAGRIVTVGTLSDSGSRPVSMPSSLIVHLSSAKNMSPENAAFELDEMHNVDLHEPSSTRDPSLGATESVAPARVRFVDPGSYVVDLGSS